MIYSALSNPHFTDQLHLLPSSTMSSIDKFTNHHSHILHPKPGSHSLYTNASDYHLVAIVYCETYFAAFLLIHWVPAVERTGPASFGWERHLQVSSRHLTLCALISDSWISGFILLWVGVLVALLAKPVSALFCWDSWLLWSFDLLDLRFLRLLFCYCSLMIEHHICTIYISPSFALGRIPLDFRKI